MSAQHLFSEWDMFTVIEHQRSEAARYVQQITAAQLQAAPEDELVDQIVERFRLNVPVMKKPYVAEGGESRVDVSRDPMRVIRNRSQPFYVPGTRVTIAIPFEGDRDLFKVLPNQFNFMRPVAEIADNEIRLTYTQAEANADAITAAYTKTLQQIEEYLNWQRPSADGFNAQLKTLVKQRISERKQKLTAGAKMIDALGLPTRPEC
jgi:hypothetical protein